MHDIPDVIYAGASFGYPVWRPAKEDERNIVFLDDEAMYHSDTKVKRLEAALKQANTALRDLRHGIFKDEAAVNGLIDETLEAIKEVLND